MDEGHCSWWTREILDFPRFPFTADRVDEKLHRRTTVRMGIRVVQRALAPPSPRQFNITGPSAFSSKRNKTPSSCKFGQEFKTSTATPSAVTEERRTSVFQQQATIEENEPPLAAPDENRQPNQKEDCHQQCEIHVNGEEMKRCLNEQMERVLSDHEVSKYVYGGTSLFCGVIGLKLI